MVPFRSVLALFPPLVLAACGSGDGRMVARASGHDLTVGEEARLLAAAGELPDPRLAALGFANRWIDYTLLATAAAEDTTFAHLDLQPLIEAQALQVTMRAVEDSVARADGSVPASELRRRYAREAPDSELRTRHIFLRVPPSAPQAAHDSARWALGELRRRVVEDGEDFAELARAHSQEARTAARGGDLGFVPGDRLLPEFEEAARALDPGEVSEPVRAGEGYHLVLLEERRTPSFEDFAARIRGERRAEAMDAFLAELEMRAAPRIDPGAPDVVRRLASRPDGDTGGGASDVLVTFDGGAVTAGDARAFLQGRSEEFRRRIAGAPDAEVVGGVLQPLARQALIAAEGRRSGLAPTDAQVDASLEVARRLVRDAARQLGFLDLGGPDRDGGDAIERAVEDVLGAATAADRPIPPLGPLATILRQHYAFELREDRLPRVVRRIHELREEAGAPAPDTVSDTAS